MSTCPCCTGVLLRHIRHGRVYWFCSHCWQEMPDPTVATKTSQLALPHFPRLINKLIPQELSASTF